MKNILKKLSEKIALLKKIKSKNGGFYQLLEQYPEKKHGVISDEDISFSVGYPPQRSISYPVEYITTPDEKTTSFGFYDFTEAEYDLFCAYLDSPFVLQTTELSLGWTSYYRGYPQIVSQAINLLGQTKLPNLKILNLGIFLLFQNSCNITKISVILQVLCKNIVTLSN